jgi:hypothetical protein
LLAPLLRALQLCAIAIEVTLRPRPIVSSLHGCAFFKSVGWVLSGHQ